MLEKKIISIPNNKLHRLLVKVIPLKSDTIFHSSLPRLKDSPGMLLNTVVTALLIAFIPWKQVHLFKV